MVPSPPAIRAVDVRVLLEADRDPVEGGGAHDVRTEHVAANQHGKLSRSARCGLGS
jgi:hypothetical protein